MSVPVRDAPPREVPERFAHWTGLLSLSVPWLLSLFAVLANEVVSYMVVPWACARQAAFALHIVPIVCLVVIAMCGATALRDWRRAGGGTEDEAATVLTRSRFLAILGVAASVFAGLVVLAMWLPMFILSPCVHS